jgi:cytoskeletal protein RodZ
MSGGSSRNEREDKTKNGKFKKGIIIVLSIFMGVFLLWWIYLITDQYLNPLDPNLMDPCSAESKAKHGGKSSPFSDD